MLRKAEDPPLESKEKFKLFMIAHWKGVVCVGVPILLIVILLPFPPKPFQWCAYTLILMAVFWVSECIPLAVTSFLPIVLFPLTGLMSTTDTCKAYVNDSILMFVGSIMLAYAVEQSGLHKRLAYAAIRIIGYSQFKLLLAMCIVTTFVSMWITNTAATTMMVPIIFALLKVFEDQKIIVMYEKNSEGDLQSSDITACYFCAITYSATIGGVGTIVGTATNLAFKGLFASAYPNAPEYLSFPKFSAFAVPYMILMELSMFLYLAVMYLGFLRPGSDVAKATRISEAAKAAARKVIDDDWKKLGRLTFWELIVIILFGGAMVSFFCRSPQIFVGWGDIIAEHFGIEDTKFVRDSSLAMMVSFLMFLLPSSLMFFRNCTAKFHEDLPKHSVTSVLDWRALNANMPFSFMFLLGGGFALSQTAKTSGLNQKLGETLQGLKVLPNAVVLFIIIVVVIFVTNFASNVAVCNVFTPICMQVAKEIQQNPLWYALASGFTSSYCFMIPVGTPGNLIVQSAAKIPTAKMMKAGFGPTISTILLTWLAMFLWAPIIWTDLTSLPDWVE